MNVVEVLVAAKATISVPGRWIKGALSTDKAGDIVSCNDETAFCFCSLGAVEHVLLDAKKNGILDRPTATKLETKAIRALQNSLKAKGIMGYGIAGFNDAWHTDLHDVMDMFDVAIKLISAPTSPKSTYNHWKAMLNRVAENRGYAPTGNSLIFDTTWKALYEKGMSPLQAWESV